MRTDRAAGSFGPVILPICAPGQDGRLPEAGCRSPHRFTTKNHNWWLRPRSRLAHNLLPESVLPLRNHALKKVVVFVVGVVANGVRRLPLAAPSALPIVATSDMVRARLVKIGSSEMCAPPAPGRNAHASVSGKQWRCHVSSETRTGALLRRLILSRACNARGAPQIAT